MKHHKTSIKPQKHLKKIGDKIRFSHHGTLDEGQIIAINRSKKTFSVYVFNSATGKYIVVPVSPEQIL